MQWYIMSFELKHILLGNAMTGILEIKEMQLHRSSNKMIIQITANIAWESNSLSFKSQCSFRDIK